MLLSPSDLVKRSWFEEDLLEGHWYVPGKGDYSIPFYARHGRGAQFEHVETAQNFPLDYINKNMSEMDKDTSYYLHCRSGYRSTVASSILKARGFEKLINVQAKFDDIAASKIPTSDYVCPSTLN